MKSRRREYCIYNKWSKCWAIVMNGALIALATWVGYQLGG